MPSISQIPARGSIAVADAIDEGHKDVTVPGRLIVGGGLLAGAVALFLGGPWWLWIGLVTGGIICRAIFRWQVIPRWRIWAYEGVADLHELQRHAELEGLLPLGMHRSVFGAMTPDQQEHLERLICRFDEDSCFVDDPKTGFVTEVMRTRLLADPAPREPALKLTSQGIGTADYGFFPWDQISSESVGIVQGSTYRTRATSALYDYTNEVFRFWLPGGVIVAYPMEELKISRTALEHLLYIYRSRWVMERTAEAGKEPSHAPVTLTEGDNKEQAITSE